MGLFDRKPLRVKHERVLPPEIAENPAKPRRMLMRSISSMFNSANASRNDRWTSTPISPDAFITMQQPVLVARSREQWSNNDYVRSFIRLVRQNIVGSTGIKLQARTKLKNGKLDAQANKAHEEAWAEWCERGNCEVTGQLSFRALCELAAVTAARDGEVIARKIYGKDAGPFGFALQMIDPQRMLVRYEAEAYGQTGNFIRQGIEFNKYGRPQAYHFTSTNEADDYWYSLNGRGFVRIPADEIIHTFQVEMVGQRRGLPWAATSLKRMHHLEGFEDASVQNARATAAKMGFIQYESGFGPEADDDMDVAGNIDAEPLSFHELPEGATIAEWNPTYPAGEFAAFTKSMLRGASAGMGVLYNNLTGDLEGVNYSSIRQGTLDERDQWKERQQWLIESFVGVAHAAWLKWSLLNGAIKNKQGIAYAATRVRDFLAVAWQGRRWTWIDPQNDVNAVLSSIRGGLTSFGAVIREQGKDPLHTYQEIATDLQEMRDAGIPDEYIKLFMYGEAPPPPQPTQDEKTEGSSK
jgi:lambda family phage portal protein